jgi:hypothetical protein
MLKLSRWLEMLKSAVCLIKCAFEKGRGEFLRNARTGVTKTRPNANRCRLGSIGVVTRPIVLAPKSVKVAVISPDVPHCETQ